MILTAARLLDQPPNAVFLRSIHPVTPDIVTVRQAPRPMRMVWGHRTKAITLGTTVFVEPELLAEGGDRLARLLMHELVHVRQWQVQGPVRFLTGYGRQYLIARLNGASHSDAYHSIAYEVEARQLSGI